MWFICRWIRKYFVDPVIISACERDKGLAVIEKDGMYQVILINLKTKKKVCLYESKILDQAMMFFNEVTGGVTEEVVYPSGCRTFSVPYSGHLFHHLEGEKKQQ